MRKRLELKLFRNVNKVAKKPLVEWKYGSGEKTSRCYIPFSTNEGSVFKK